MNVHNLDFAGNFSKAISRSKAEEKSNCNNHRTIIESPELYVSNYLLWAKADFLISGGERLDRGCAQPYSKMHFSVCSKVMIITHQ